MQLVQENVIPVTCGNWGVAVIHKKIFEKNSD